MAQIGNKINSFLNGEWAKHVRGTKKTTSKLRRAYFKRFDFKLKQDGKQK